MDEKKTYILDFQVSQGDAISELSATKKLILQLKDEQNDLNKAYKAGEVSIEAYSKQMVVLEASLKKTADKYNTIQRQVTGLKSPFDKLNESIKSQAQSVNIAGVSLQNFANPVSATVAGLGLLFKAYSSSTIGAKDLEFASNTLSSALTQATNSFAGFISSSKDGEGLFSKLTYGIVSYFSPAVAGIAMSIANLKEQLEDLGREEISIREENNSRLEDNAEILAKVQDSQTSYQEKVHLTSDAIINLRKNEEALAKVKQSQLENLQQQLAADSENEDLQTAVLQAQKDISKVHTDTERKVQNIIKLESNLKDAEEKRLQTLSETTSEMERQARIAEYERSLQDQRSGFQKLTDKSDTEADAIKLKVDANTSLSNSLDTLTVKTEKITKAAKEKSKADKQSTQDLLVLSNTVGVLQGAFAQNTVAYKAVAISKATVDTYLAADNALAQLPVPANFIAAGALVAAGLANVAQISQAAGGGSFLTKGPTMLMVGDNPGGVEKVDVTPISGRGETKVRGNLVQMGGGGTLVTNAGMFKDNSFKMPEIKVYTIIREQREALAKYDFKNQLVER